MRSYVDFYDEGAMFREAVTPSVVVPGATQVTHSSGVSHSPLAPVVSL